MNNLTGKIIGGCRIVSKIGHGGMGAVYKAHHLALDIPVAIKILQPLSATEGAEERFLREARIAARLRHPHIIGVHDVGCEKGLHYIIMEYIEGRDLLSIIKETGGIKPDEAVRIAIEVLEALQFAMENGIVHRDIKPENILLEKGRVKLADLGLARIDGDPSLTQSNTVLGSPHYVAPEQAENPGAADCRSDIYSLGCTLYHMMAGNVPYQGSTPVEIILNHIKTPAPILHLVNPDIPEPLSRVVSKMMEKDPDARLKTPLEAIAALKKAMDNTQQQQQPLPPPPVETAPVQPPEKKNDSAALLLTLASICIMIVLSVFLFRTPSKGHLVENPTDLAAEQKPEQAKPTDTNKVDQSRKPKKTSPKKRKAPEPKPVSQNISKPAAGKNPVLEAVKIGDTGELKRLLKEGASPDVPAGSPTTPLHEAVRRGSSEQTELLLKMGARPNVRDKNGDAPLHYALRENAVLIVKILLKGGADANLKDRRGRTPLKIASGVDTELEKIVKEYGGR